MLFLFCKIIAIVGLITTIHWLIIILLSILLTICGKSKSAKNYFWNNLIAFDQSCNTLLGGDPDETISSRAWKLWIENGIKWPKKLIDFFFGKAHCENALEEDEGENKTIK